MKVLFLSAWYPHRYDAMSGLFVRKHAEAASLFNEVQVLYAKEDPLINKYEIVNSSDKIKETIVYYPTSKLRILRGLHWFKAMTNGYKAIKSTGFTPEIIHANVLTRCALIAYLIGRKEHIPFVVSEHWSRYLKENFSFRAPLHKALTKYVVKQASCIMPVSQVLMQSMIECGLKNKNYQVVHNTIDNQFLQSFPPIQRTKKRFIHISCFENRSKNISGIIKAAAQLQQRRRDWELIMIGTGIDIEEIKQLSSELNIKHIQFIGEQTPLQVANWLQNSDCTIQFSNYETFGIVLIESLASGTPVITTHCGVADEIINKQNGLFVAHNDIDELTNQMDWILDNLQQFNPDAMKSIANNYTQKIIGQKLHKIYLASTAKS